MENTFFLEKFREQFDEADPATIQLEKPFREIEEWSSLIALCIIAMVDQEYQVKLTGEDIRSSVTVNDIYNKVIAKK